MKVTICKSQKIVHSKKSVKSVTNRHHRVTVTQEANETAGWKPVYSGKFITRKGGK